MRIFPELPIATIILPYLTPFRVPENPDVLEIHEVPSEEVRIVPLSPTATYNPLEVVVVEDSSFSPQEKMMKLKINMEKMMSICLTRFPIIGLGEPNI